MDGRLILVVDDEEAIRSLVADVLASEGYTVAEASNGREALRMMERSQPTLILLDLNMPILDGIGFVKSLVARKIVVPIILVSAAVNLRKSAADLGAVGFIAKPFDIAFLLTTVERHYRMA